MHRLTLSVVSFIIPVFIGGCGRTDPEPKPNVPETKPNVELQGSLTLAPKGKEAV
jgi:hypothetical protein